MPLRPVERLTAAAVAVQLIAALGAVASHHEAPLTAAAVERPAAPVPPVRALLTAREQALRTHDRAAFVATAVPQLAEEQGRLYDALTRLPLARWSWTVDGPVPTAPPFSVPATLSTALRGYDATPVRQHLRLTAVRSGGSWRLSDPGRGSSLWDAGPTTVAAGRSCLVVGHPERAALVRSLVAECDAAVPRVTAVWGSGWARRVVLLVPDDAGELARLVPGAGELGEVAALETAEPTGGRVPAGERVLVNPAVFGRLGPVGRRVVLTHEVTHVASRAATGPQVPTWLVEGLADWVGYAGTGVPLPVAARELQADVRDGRVPTALPDEAAYSRGPVAQAYEEGWLAVRLLAERYGQARLLALYRAVGADPRPGALDRALARLGTDRRALTAAWRADLSRRLG